MSLSNQETSRHPWAKRLAFALLLVVALVLGVTGYLQPRLLGGSPKSNDGLKPAPSFSLKRSNGETLRLADWKGEMVVVHFWASWCAPCIPEIPEILAAAKKLPKDQSGRPIHWLLVSQDESWEKAHTILKESTLPENVVAVLDPEAKGSDLFGSYQFPETYLITREGGLAAKWIGAQEWTGKWGDAVLQGIEEASRFNKLPAPSAP